MSEHFRVSGPTSEFKCRCGCGFGTKEGDVNPALVDVLEDVRAHFGKPVVVNSGCRCPAYNAKVGGVPSSQHLKGTAADIRVSDVSPREVHDYLNGKYTDRYGVGKYANFTHVDVRPNKSRWG